MGTRHIDQRRRRLAADAGLALGYLDELLVSHGMSASPALS
ncbi:hypothetical protein [Actinomadura madurae]|nr:hypothetical protein [Actinomadura madurae]